MREKLTAFVGGFITAVAPSAPSIFTMFSDLAGKIFVTAALGIVGGISGLFAKELLWPWCKKKILWFIVKLKQ